MVLLHSRMVDETNNVLYSETGPIVCDELTESETVSVTTYFFLRTTVAFHFCKGCYAYFDAGSHYRYVYIYSAKAAHTQLQIYAIRTFYFLPNSIWIHHFHRKQDTRVSGIIRTPKSHIMACYRSGIQGHSAELNRNILILYIN